MSVVMKLGLWKRWRATSRCVPLGIFVVGLTLVCGTGLTHDQSALGGGEASRGRPGSEAVGFSSARFPSRDIRTQSPYFQPDHTGTNPEYLVHPNDVLSCWLESSDKLLKLSAANPVDFSWMLKGDLSVRYRELRIPCSLFLVRALESMVISVSDAAAGPSATIPIYDSNNESWLIDAESISWSRLSAMMEKWVVPVFRAKKYTLRYRLLPQERVYPVPGQRIVMNRVSRLPKEIGNRDNSPHVADVFDLIVDADGFLQVPATTNAAARAPEFAIERWAFAEVGGATNRIRVCFPQLPVSERCTLVDIGACLSASPGPQEILPGYVDRRCRLMGIDHHIRPMNKDEMRENIRYYLSTGARTWTLILANGDPKAVPYSSATPLRQAVEWAFRERTGSDLFREADSVTVEVITEAGRVGPDEPRILGGVLLRDQASDLDGALILPGDVVRILPPR